MLFTADSDSHRRRWRAVAVGAAALAVSLAGGWLAAASPSGAEEAVVQTAPATDPLAERGYAVTGGAAPGYVDDQLCGSCHTDLYRSYQDVAMAKSFYRPRPDNDIEDFTQGYYHEPSRRHYRMIRREGKLIMQRHQLAADGEPIHEIEQEVEWILGSGNHSRTYLVRTPNGELYQLPLAWYTQTESWGMSPGFDRPGHLGLSRLVRRECMFCHNAYPDVPAGSDAHNAPHVYPEELPEGLGCQRCHGPGAEHARVAMAEDVDFERLYTSIVNPGDLGPRLRDDVCYQCHMQPSVAIPGSRHFGRHDYSFRPGEPLADYLVGLDVIEADQDRHERFEINHHPYRLEQSRCFTASQGAESQERMSCLTCHDPHRKVQPAERVAHYRAACLGCHEVDACRLEEMAGSVATPAVAADDCVACHMQERRPQDVVRVTMTDHLIRRRPGGPELLAPLEERDPDIEDVVFTDPKTAPKGDLGDLYRAYTVASVTGGDHAVATAKLEQLVAEIQPAEPEPYLALARGQLKQGRAKAAQQTLEALLERSPDYPMARGLLGLVTGTLGQREAGMARILETIERGQDRPEERSNLGVLLIQLDRPADAVRHLERAVEMRPNMSAAWFFLGLAQAELDRLDAAAASLRQSLAIEPRHDRTYVALARVLLKQARRAEALRYLLHGAEHASQPEAIIKALEQIEPGAAAKAGIGK